MRISAEGSTHFRADASAESVCDVMADPDQLLHVLQGLLHPDSTPKAWHMPQARLGPVVIAPAVGVVLEREGRHVRITGRPLDGFTPAWLEIATQVDGGDDAAAARSTWSVAIEVPGPQLMATTLRPLVVAGARRTAHRVADRVRRHAES